MHQYQSVVIPRVAWKAQGLAPQQGEHQEHTASQTPRPATQGSTREWGQLELLSLEALATHERFVDDWTTVFSYP